MTAPARDLSSGPQESPGFLLWRTTLRWQRAISAALRPLELTHVQFVLLATVWWLSGQADDAEAPSQRQVADHAEVDVMMTSQVVRALEARGLIRRAPDPGDARVKRITVTDAGGRLAREAVTLVEAADAEFFTRVRNPAHLLEVLSQLSDGG